MRSYRARLVLVGLLLVVALTGCDLRLDKTPKLQSDWSRGVRLGVSAWNQPAALQVEPNGERVHVVWFASSTGGMNPHYVQLDEQAQVLVDRTIEVTVLLPKEPRLLRDAAGNLHLFVRANRRAEEPDGVVYLLLSPQGALQGEPLLLSSQGQEVSSFEAVLNQAGQLDVFWSLVQGTGADLYHLRLDCQGRPIAPARLLVSGAHDPTARVAEDGTLHLAWLRKPDSIRRELYYAAFPQAAVAPVAGSKITDYSGGMGAVLYKPVLGLDSRHVYVFWASYAMAGVSAGTAASSYVTFPLGQPAYQQPLPIALPPAGTPAYMPYQGPYGYRQLAYPATGPRMVGSEVLFWPAPLPGQKSELPVLFGEQVYFRFKGETQPVLAVFAEGQLRGYQVIARSPDLAIYPAAVADTTGNLHTIWLNSASQGFEVYYTSTSPLVKARLDRTEAKDYEVRAVNLAWGMLSGLVLIALLPVIFLPALAWLLLYHLFGGSDALRERSAWLALGVAIVLYLGAKALIFGAFLPPLSLVALVPARFASLATWGLLLGIAALACLAVYLYNRRKEGAPVFFAAIIFVLVDALLTMLTYGPSIIGG